MWLQTRCECLGVLKVSVSVGSGWSHLLLFLGEVTNPRLTCFITLQWLYPSILVMINLNPSILVMINNLTLLYWS